MAINVTWRNIFVLVGLATTVVAAMAGGTAFMVQWRFNALQLQLNERMKLYEREFGRIERRVDKLEAR